LKEILEAIQCTRRKIRKRARGEEECRKKKEPVDIVQESEDDKEDDKEDVEVEVLEMIKVAEFKRKRKCRT
jgi:hypothetical protein